jgi:hypothetical protein
MGSSSAPDALPLEFDTARLPRRKEQSSSIAVSADLLTASARAVAHQYAAADEWAGSPFAYLRTLPTASRAKAAEAMVEYALRQLGFRVAARTHHTHDRVVEGRKVRIKFSTLWRTGLYTFQQVRDEKYDYLVLLGVSPQEGHLWVLSRTVALSLVGYPTAWISFAPADPPAALRSAGGHLAALAPVLVAAFGPPSNAQ